MDHKSVHIACQSLDSEPYRLTERYRFLGGFSGFRQVPLLLLADVFRHVDPDVGVGIGRVRYDHANSFAVQGILGVEYSLPFLPDLSVGGEYRYLKINETTGKTTAPSKFHTNVLMLKARYMF